MARDFTVEVMRLLDDYSEEVRDIARKDIQSVARATAKELRNSSPKSEGGGDYARGWTTTKQGDGWVVYNKTHAPLTHLLENGHLIKNQYGSWSRKKDGSDSTRPIKHIEPAEKAAAEKLAKKVEEDIEKI